MTWSNSTLSCHEEAFAKPKLTYGSTKMHPKLGIPEPLTSHRTETKLPTLGIYKSFRVLWKQIIDFLWTGPQLITGQILVYAIVRCNSIELHLTWWISVIGKITVTSQWYKIIFTFNSHETAHEPSLHEDCHLSFVVIGTTSFATILINELLH